MSESAKKTETKTQAPDYLKENYSKALETATKLQEQYFENVKKATDYLQEMQNAWIGTTTKAASVSPEMLRIGVTSEAYRSMSNFWMKQFETLSKLVGMPTMPTMPTMPGFMESTADATETFSKAIDIYTKSYATFIELTKKNMEIASQNVIDVQKNMLQTYKGLMPSFVVSEEDKAKVFDWITEGTKKSIESSTTIVNKQLEMLAVLIQDLSVNIKKLSSTLKGETPKK